MQFVVWMIRIENVGEHTRNFIKSSGFSDDKFVIDEVGGIDDTYRTCTQAHPRLYL